MQPLFSHPRSPPAARALHPGTLVQHRFARTPYMAQRAATSIEDAAILARCLAAVDGDDIEGAFKT